MGFRTFPNDTDDMHIHMCACMPSKFLSKWLSRTDRHTKNFRFVVWNKKYQQNAHKSNLCRFDGECPKNEKKETTNK